MLSIEGVLQVNQFHNILTCTFETYWYISEKSKNDWFYLSELWSVKMTFCCYYYKLSNIYDTGIYQVFDKSKNQIENIKTKYT